MRLRCVDHRAVGWAAVKCDQTISWKINSYVNNSTSNNLKSSEINYIFIGWAMYDRQENELQILEQPVAKSSYASLVDFGSILDHFNLNNIPKRFLPLLLLLLYVFCNLFIIHNSADSFRVDECAFRWFTVHISHVGWRVECLWQSRFHRKHKTTADAKMSINGMWKSLEKTNTLTNTVWISNERWRQHRQWRRRRQWNRQMRTERMKSYRIDSNAFHKMIFRESTIAICARRDKMFRWQFIKEGIAEGVVSCRCEQATALHASFGFAESAF